MKVLSEKANLEKNIESKPWENIEQFYLHEVHELAKLGNILLGDKNRDGQIIKKSKRMIMVNLG